MLKRGPAAMVAEEFGKAAGLPTRVRDVMSKAAMQMQGGLMRPELLNRIDEVVVFHQLQKEALGSIVEIQLSRLRKRLAERGISLDITDAAKLQLASEGWDPVFGARPLKRTIQQRIENAMATRILSGEFGDGDGVRVDWNGGQFVFAK
jgi:ATP-dependent Clp protease ATP-binding subunit ClpB